MRILHEIIEMYNTSVGTAVVGDGTTGMMPSLLKVPSNQEDDEVETEKPDFFSKRLTQIK